jgi:hypothetical protein
MRAVVVAPSKTERRAMNSHQQTSSLPAVVGRQQPFDG